jgi:hypothetical protein
MTENEIFDPVRSAAIRRMLVRTAAQSPRRRARIAFITTLVALAALLAGGSTAYALGVRPFTVAAPTPTPTHTVAPTPRPTPVVTPTVTPTPVQNFGPPIIRPGIGCSGLGANSIASFLPTAKSETGNAPLYPELAAARATGYEGCYWAGSGNQSVSVEVSADVAHGRSDIATQHAKGHDSFGVGDESSQYCTEAHCVVSIVTNRYWAMITYSLRHPSASQAKAFAQRTVARLNSAPPVGHIRIPSAASWSTLSGCVDIDTTPSMASVLRVSSLNGPAELESYNMQPAPPSYLECNWEPAPKSKVYMELDVAIAPGVGWGYAQGVKGGRTATVAGADAASTECTTTEDGIYCDLDVLSDHAWLQLNLESTHASPDVQKTKLIHAAEAILAAHNAGS